MALARLCAGWISVALQRLPPDTDTHDGGSAAGSSSGVLKQRYFARWRERVMRARAAYDKEALMALVVEAHEARDQAQATVQQLQAEVCIQRFCCSLAFCWV